MDGELGQLLRTWRDRIPPAAAGLSVHGRRRARGLRREELAGLAHLSVDYVTRLEQGRSGHPSPQVLSALATALRLSPAEEDHLFQLAGQQLPSRPAEPPRPTPGVQRMLERMPDLPVSVLDTSMTLVAWNPLWAALMGDPGPAYGRDRNLLWRHFTGRPGRVVRGDHDIAAFEAAAVADLRTTAARRPHDEDLRALIDDLIAVSQRFAGLWEERRVAVHTESRKTIDHPRVGRVTVDCDVLTVHGTDLRMIVYSASPDSPDADALTLLSLDLGRPETAGSRLSIPQERAAAAGVGS